MIAKPFRLPRLSPVFFAIAFVVCAVFGALAGIELNVNVAAAPLDTKGVPADVQGIAHVDFDACLKTPLAGAFTDAFEKASAQSAKNQAKRAQYEEFKTQTGFDPARDLNDITFGFYKKTIADGRVVQSAVAVARGKFSPEKLTAYARKNNCAVIRRGQLVLIDASHAVSAAQQAAGDDALDRNSSQPAIICIADARTLLFAEDMASMEKLIGAIGGKTPSYAAPASLREFAANAGFQAPLMLAYAGRALTVGGEDLGLPLPVDKAEDYRIAIGGTGGNLCARVSSRYASADAAESMRRTMGMLMFVANMAVDKMKHEAENGGGQVSPGDAKRLQKLMQGLRMEVVENRFELGVDFPAEDFVNAVREKIAAGMPF